MPYLPQEEKKAAVKTPHNVIMENRNSVSISGVTDIDRYDEFSVVLFTQYGMLTVSGKGLHVNRLSVDTGEMQLEGEIYSLEYSNQEKKTGQNLISRLFK